MASGGVTPSEARQILESYVSRGRLTQIATVDAASNPAVCNVWYDYGFAPDTISFMSRHDRDHSKNIRDSERVAGAIVAIKLDALGQKVQGVTFKGVARELDPASFSKEVAKFIQRWPAAEPALTPGGVSRLYEIAITEWVLFDELNFPDAPRQVLPPIR